MKPLSSKQLKHAGKWMSLFAFAIWYYAYNSLLNTNDLWDGNEKVGKNSSADHVKFPGNINLINAWTHFL